MASGKPFPFAELLKRQRGRAGLTQEALAEQARLSARAISDLERGVRRTPHLTTVHLLAQALGLNPEDRAAFIAAASRARTDERAGLRLAGAPAARTRGGTH